MNVRFFPSPDRFFASILIGLAALHSACSPAAEAHDFPNTCNYSDELCGWVDIDRSENAPADPLATIKAFDGYVAQSIEALRQMNRWWNLGKQLADRLAAIKLQSALAEVTAEEPIDVESLGPSVLEKVSASLEGTGVPGVELTPIDPLVGSAAMIATIDESYLPYDLSAADLRLRSFYPLSTEPFCIRSRIAGWNQVPLRPEFIETAPAATAADGSAHKEPDIAVSGPIDCWLEELAYRVDQWSQQAAKLHPVRVGEQLALVAERGNQLVQAATESLVASWPEPATQPSAAGRALLTRAGATGSSAPLQLAEVPGATTVR